MSVYYIEEFAKKYDVVTPFKDTRRHMKLLEELLRRVDIVPPSILIASAAIHTDWGTSRVALEGNNLYQAREWYTQEGLVPEDEPEEPYRYKIYPSLEASVRDYVLKVNTNLNYAQFWDFRKETRRRDQTLYGHHSDWAFLLDSNLTNYAGLLDYTLSYYKFYHIDESELESVYEFGD